MFAKWVAQILKKKPKKQQQQKTTQQQPFPSLESI